MALSLGINTTEDELSEASAYCRRNTLGIEVTAFAFPSGLDQALNARIDRHAAAVADLNWNSLHGPFLDLYPASGDPAIVEVCRMRHQAALAAATTIASKIYVAHLSSLPLIRNEGYWRRFAGATAEFWLPLADEAGKHGVTIVLENLWEPRPEIQKEVLEVANHPHLKASFDNGHALVFSNESAVRWIEILGTDLAHCHLHDNNGTYDQHKPIGTGTENWPALLNALREHAPTAFVVLESDKLDANQESLGNLKAMGSADAV